MVKCVVSACQNRVLPESRGDSSRAKKRFFSFPVDPARVKVWLAALRQTEGQDSTQHRQICEDHFLPEDVTSDGVSSDAIPIMPPNLDEQLGVMSSWRAELSEEEEEEELHHHQKSSPKESSQRKKSVEVNQTLKKKQRNKAVPLKLLMQHFLQMFLAAPGGSLNMRDVYYSLGYRPQRLTQFRNVMCGLKLLEHESIMKLRWISECPVINFLWRYDMFHKDLELLEETLDSLIRSCSEQLFTITNDRENAAMAYVTHSDISQMSTFQDQKWIIIKAPDETMLKVLQPQEDRIQIHLKGATPTTALTSDDMVFISLEESGMKMATASDDAVQSVNI